MADQQPESIRQASLNDQVTADDALGFKPYVEAIAEFLLSEQTKPPLTLSIEGEWGSGKSSFMKRLKAYLEEKGGRTVWFNAWRHDQAEQVWAAFALSFIEQISTAKSLSDLPRIIRGYVWLQYLRLNRAQGYWELFKAVVQLLIVISLMIAIPIILFRYEAHEITLLDIIGYKFAA